MLASNGAWAQAGRTIRLIVPYQPGGGNDILARLLAGHIGRTQGPSVVIENRAGGGSVIGTEAVARAVPDGNTLLLSTSDVVITPHLRKLSYDPLTTFEPVCYLVDFPLQLVVNGSSPFRTLADLLTAACAKPNTLTLAADGPAMAYHIAFGAMHAYLPYLREDNLALPEIGIVIPIADFYGGVEFVEGMPTA
jgi:tripartite-type tricarboxylate transporter receptor subunit TctC